MTHSNDKIDAIYDLREAVAKKARLETVVGSDASDDTRSALLDATLEVEAKTQHAIEACHECGELQATGTHMHTGAMHSVSGNVISVDFGQRTADDAR